MSATNKGVIWTARFSPRGSLKIIPCKHKIYSALITRSIKFRNKTVLALSLEHNTEFRKSLHYVKTIFKSVN
jgi:hypothetical protein